MKKEDVSRRDFLKTAGGTALAVSTIAMMPSCARDKSSAGVDSPYSTSLDEIKAENMEYRINPRTNDKVSLLGYGCMRLPMKNEGEEEIIDQETWNELVDIAIEKGVNYFDTAPVYGRGKSEEATGIALSRHPRNKYMVATKMSNFREHSREASLELYRNSFEKLQVDYIDYYLLHGIGMGGMEAFQARFIDNGILDFLLEERKKGKIRNLGWSFHGDIAVFDHLLSLDIEWDFAQIQLNYMDWRHATGWNVNAEYLYNELVKHNVPAVVMEPLLGGRLAKLDYISKKLLQQQQPDASLASWAFRYAGTPKEVITVLSGMTFKEHLIDNLDTYSPFTPLDEKEIKLLDEVTELVLKFPLVKCTECGYCMPCPYGIDIPKVFAHYNKCISEGYFTKSNTDKNYEKARKAFLVGYDRTVPKLRQANHCIGCKKCIPLCTQRINIPEEMTKIDAYVEELKLQKS